MWKFEVQKGWEFHISIATINLKGISKAFLFGGAETAERFAHKSTEPIYGRKIKPLYFPSLPLLQVWFTPKIPIKCCKYHR